MTGPQWVVRLEKKERSAMKMNVETLETHFFCYHYIFLLQWTLEKEISRCIFLVAFFFFPTLFRVSQIQKETSQTHISIGFTTSKGFHNYFTLFQIFNFCPKTSTLRKTCKINIGHKSHIGQKSHNGHKSHINQKSN